MTSRSPWLLTSAAFVATLIASAGMASAVNLHPRSSSAERSTKAGALRSPAGDGHSETKQHPWPSARGPMPGQSGATDIRPPPDLEKTLAWSWHHPLGRYHTLLAGGVAIDKDENLYLMARDGLRKFSKDGVTLWYFKPPGRSNNMPALMGDYVYVNTYTDGQAFALNQTTGEPVWVVRPSENAGPDGGYPAAYEGLFVMGTEMGTDERSPGGNNKVIALDGQTGKQVWEYRTEYPVWNLMPLFPGDDSTVFMDFTGGVYKLGLHNGTEIWHTRAPGSAKSYTDGGAILGPNGVVYTCSNPGADTGRQEGLGALRAFQVSDGKMLWQQLLPQACNSYPSVGHLGGSGALSVVITPGSFMGSPRMSGGIMAFDADTGMPQWQFQAPLYTPPPGVPSWQAAYGDYQGFEERGGKICLPAHWSAPAIDGDGTVYAGRSDGKLYIVQGPAVAEASERLPNLAGVDSTALLGNNYDTSTGVEVSIFDAQGASLHGATAFAPGMMAFSTCDTLYVFKF